MLVIMMAVVLFDVVVLLDEVGGALSHHHDGDVDVAAEDLRYRRTVHYSKRL